MPARSTGYLNLSPPEGPLFGTSSALLLLPLLLLLLPPLLPLLLLHQGLQASSSWTALAGWSTTWPLWVWTGRCECNAPAGVPCTLWILTDVFHAVSECCALVA
jgi:hypothetical protein